ncbi:MAG: hypothetical protein KAJ49_09150 [Arcobacteraceae bacterium]|nr:hypothetical protein [Arcobacteraceae bacterium]
MKNINPLFLTIACAIILSIAIFSLDSAKKSLKVEKKEFEEFKQLAVKYNTLQKHWGDKKLIIENIQKILKSSGIRNANIIEKNKTVVVQIVSMNITQVDKFVNKLLNERLSIKKLEITKNKIILEVGIL